MLRLAVPARAGGNGVSRPAAPGESHVTTKKRQEENYYSLFLLIFLFNHSNVTIWSATRQQPVTTPRQAARRMNLAAIGKPNSALEGRP
jgi:hypothetical protein